MWLLFLLRLIVVCVLLYGVFWLFDREYNSPVKQEEERRRKLGLLLIVFVGVLVAWSSVSNLVETNNSGFYQVKQAAWTGSMSVRSTPGMYWQGYGTIVTYPLSGEYFFGKNAGIATDEAPIEVRFADGSKANVHGMIKFRLSSAEQDQLLLNADYKSYSGVLHSLIRAQVQEAAQRSAKLMKAEESYSTRSNEYMSLTEQQLIEGILETVSNVQKTKDADGNEFIETNTTLKLINNKPVVSKPSPFPRYHVEVLQFILKDIDYDETIESLINKKKEAEQQKVVARANAERAKQDAITAREQGEAKIAVAKAEEEVKKITAVVEAQKEYEVSKLERLQSEQEAQSAILAGKAAAEVNRLKVTAGLTPQERAEYQMKTAIGVAEKLSQLHFPQMMILGGGSTGGHAMNPFDAVGLESFMRISEGLATKKAVEK